jgi:UTP--glucose-1-phosphate uridylyltransferase
MRPRGVVYNPPAMSPARRPAPIRKAVFPAAGLGTRFLPATKAQPKEMLPLVDKPVIQYVVEEAVASGIETIIIVTGRGKSAIEDHFDVAFELEHLLEERGKVDLLEQVRSITDLIKVSYVRQKEPLGLGHAILMARDLVGHEPFAVFLGDDIIEAKVPVMRQMMEVYERCGCSVIGVERVSRERTADYGIVAGRPADGRLLGVAARGKAAGGWRAVSRGRAIAGGKARGRLLKVSDLVEKPPPEKAPSNLAIIGRYILMPEIFDHLKATTPGRGGEIQLTDGLRSLLHRQDIYAYSFEGTRYDTGDKLGFLRATVEFALRRPDLGAAFRDYLEHLDLDGVRSRRRVSRPSQRPASRSTSRPGRRTATRRPR